MQTARHNRGKGQGIIMSETRKTLADVLDEVKGLTAYRLSSEADCGTPDSSTSPGAFFLERIRNAVVERVSDDPAAFDPDGPGDLSDEIADDAPSIYTHDRWQQFVDLGAYNEDPTELGVDCSDLTATAGVCLYMIAERLVQALWAIIAEAFEESDD
jgi:hypothetical protein